MIPLPAMILGLVGISPFMAGAALARWPIVHPLLASLAEENRMLVHYGVVILCFISGILWGFATRAEGRDAWIGYGLASLPALWAFMAAAPGHDFALWALIIGFAGLLLLDLWFWQEGLAPRWWLRFRLVLTAGTLFSLGSAL